MLSEKNYGLVSVPTSECFVVPKLDLDSSSRDWRSLTYNLEELLPLDADVRLELGALNLQQIASILSSGESKQTGYVAMSVHLSKAASNGDHDIWNADVPVDL